VALTKVSYSMIEGAVANVLDFGATGDGIADDTAEIQAAINSFGAEGGTVFFPAGSYKTTTALSMVANVSLVGAGANSSIIKPVGCHGVEFGYSAGFQYTLISQIGFDGFDGTNASTYTAIHQTPPADFATEIYGINIKDVYVTYFDTAIYFASTRNVIIDNCWFQWVNNGIILVGNAIGINITNNWIICIGSGATKLGVSVDGFTFSISGFRRPEHIFIHGNQFFACTTAISLNAAVYVSIIAADIYATSRGIVFSTISGNLSITHCYIEMNGNNAVGILGAGQDTPLIGNANVIENNYFISTGGTNTVGVQLSVTGQTNQFWNTVVGNSFSGFSGFDISLFNAGFLTVLDNKCFSTTPTFSISFNGPVFGLVFIDQNYCAKDIYQDPNTYTSLNYVLGTNTINATTTSYGKQSLVSTPPTSGTWPRGSRVYNSAPASGGYVGWVCTVGGIDAIGSITSGSANLTLTSAAGANGQSITVDGAGAAGVALTTTISSGGGTVNIVLAATASTTVTNAVVTGPETWETFGLIS
jgi:hypothetical protein